MREGALGQAHSRSEFSWSEGPRQPAPQKAAVLMKMEPPHISAGVWKEL